MTRNITKRRSLFVYAFEIPIYVCGVFERSNVSTIGRIERGDAFRNNFRKKRPGERLKSARARVYTPRLRDFVFTRRAPPNAYEMFAYNEIRETRTGQCSLFARAPHFSFSFASRMVADKKKTKNKKATIVLNVKLNNIFTDTITTVDLRKPVTKKLGSYKTENDGRTIARFVHNDVETNDVAKNRTTPDDE